MFVSSYLELHTTVLAWMLYGRCIDVLSASSLIIWPFLWNLLSGSFEAIGEETSRERHSTTVTHIRNTIGGIVVLITCVLPVYPVHPTEVRFLAPVSISNDSVQEVNAETDPSTYKNTIGAVVKQSGDVRIPLWWRLLHGLSTGITHALIQSLPSQLDLRQAKVMMSSTNITNRETAVEYRNFVNECYVPAHAKFRRMEGAGKMSLPPGEKLDLDWAGSRTLMQMPGGYLPCHDSAVCGAMLHPPDHIAAQFADPGTASCADWWGTLEEKLYQEDKVNDDLYKALRGPHAPPQFRGMTEDDRRAYRVKNVLNNFAASRGNSSREISAESQDHSTGFWGGALEVGGDLVATKVLLEKGLEAEVTLGIIKQAAPMTVAVLQLFFIIFMPFGMVFTLYRPAAVIAISFLMFSLIFCHALFAIAGWLDYYLAVSLFDDYSLGSWFQGGDHLFGNAQKRMLLNIVMAGAYTIIPIFWMMVMGAIGVGAGREGNALMGGRTGMDPGGVGGTAGGQAKGMAKGVASVATKAAGGGFKF